MQNIVSILDVLKVCGGDYRAHTMENEYVVYIDEVARNQLLKLSWVGSVEPYTLFVKVVP